MATKPKPAEMSADEFLLWCLTQDEKYELVDGEPVAMYGAEPSSRGAPTRAMAGASRSHDRIVSNVIGVLYAQLKGSACWAATSDTALRTKIKRIRRPDVTIECAPPDAASYEAQNPVVTFEVLSPTTQRTDKLAKLPEYMRHPRLRTIVMIDPNAWDVLVYQRDDKDDWLGTRLRRPDDVVEVGGTTVVTADGSTTEGAVARVRLADIYAGVLTPP
jgi:Uma2 family endonuclease